MTEHWDIFETYGVKRMSRFSTEEPKESKKKYMAVPLFHGGEFRNPRGLMILHLRDCRVDAERDAVSMLEKDGGIEYCYITTVIDKYAQVKTTKTVETTKPGRVGL